jgi:capsular polysaccharide transport system permease protein
MPDAQLTARPADRQRHALRPATEDAATAAMPQPISLPARSTRHAGRGGWLICAAALLLFLAYAAQQLFWSSPVYETEIRFAVRQADAPRMTAGPSVLGASMLPTITESHAVVQYLRSRDALAELEERLPLREMLGRPEIDWLARVPPDAPPERLLHNLSRFVRPQFEHTSGIITVRVRAFTPEETLALARTVEALAERLVNRMSLGARQGLLAAVQAEASAAEERLSRLRDELLTLRRQTEQLDPRRTAAAADGLRSRLEAEIAEQRVQLTRMLRFQSEQSPAVRQQRASIEALETELRDQIRRAVGSGDEALTLALRRYEALDGEMQSAQRSYEALLATLERTRGDANRQQIYLAHIVRPTLPGSFDMTTRWTNVGTAAGLGLLGALLLLLVGRTIREHVT